MKKKVVYMGVRFLIFLGFGWVAIAPLSHAATVRDDLVSYWSFDTPVETFEAYDSSRWTLSGGAYFECLDGGNSGLLVVTYSGSTTWGNSMATTQNKTPLNQYLTGDFDVQINFELASMSVPESLWSSLRLTVHDGSDFSYVAFRRMSDGSYNYHMRTNDTASMSTTDTSGTLRMRRLGNLLTGYFWDGSTGNWVCLGSTVAVTGSAYLQIGAWNGGGDNTVSGSFKYLRIQGGTLMADGTGQNDATMAGGGSQFLGNPACESLDDFSVSMSTSLSIVDGRLKLLTSGNGYGSAYHAADMLPANMNGGDIVEISLDLDTSQTVEDNILVYLTEWTGAWVRCSPNAVLSNGHNTVYVEMSSAPTTGDPANLRCRIYNPDATMQNGEYYTVDNWTARKVGPRVVDGPSGQALFFDGNDDLVNGGADTSLDPSGSFSMAAWLKTDVMNWDPIFTKGVDANDRYYLYTVGSGRGEALFGFNSAASPNWEMGSSDTVVTDGSWHHVMGVYDHAGQVQHIYVDGELERSDSIVIDNFTGGAATIGGDLIFNGYYEGAIDEPAFWSEALSPMEVWAVYQNGEDGNAVIDARIISGQVAGEAGLSGAVLTLPNGMSTTTDVSGAYELVVPKAWSGAVSVSHPTLSGTINPSSRNYSMPYVDYADQDYSVSCTLSGTVLDGNGDPAAGVTVTVSDGVSDVTTSGDGTYEAVVPYGWSGSVTPTAGAWDSYIPREQTFTSVTENQSGIDFAWSECPSSVVGYWTFDDGTAADAVGAHNGTVSGATGVSGVVDDALQFDGGDYVTIGDGTDLDFGSDDFTVQAWVRKASSSSSYSSWAVVSKWGGQGDPVADCEWSMGATDGGNDDEPVFMIAEGSSAYKVSAPSDISLNEWHHLVGVRDGSTIRLYVDGVEVDSESVGTASVNNQGRTLRIGAAGDTPYYHFDGDIDEVAVFNEALTSNQVAKLYATSLAGHTYCEAEDYVLISGRITDYIVATDQGDPVEGVTITTSGGVDPVTTDSRGYFWLIAPSGWSGAVTPSKSGVDSFSPSIHSYDSVTADQLGQDFTAYLHWPVISGSVLDMQFGVGVPNATLQISGTPSWFDTSINTSNQPPVGAYSIAVPPGWSGTITPSYGEVGFLPSSRTYSDMQADTADQDYEWQTARSVSLSGNGQEIPSGHTTPSTDDDTDFGTHTVGHTHDAVLTLSNSGTRRWSTYESQAYSQVFWRSIGGNAASDFSLVDADPDLSSGLSAGGTMDLTWRFSPSAAGERTSQIELIFRDLQYNPVVGDDVLWNAQTTYTFTLKGTATVAPEMWVYGNNQHISDGDTTPTTTDGTDFGPIATGGGSDAHTFIVTNRGSGTLTLDAIGITGAHADDFEVTISPSGSVAGGAKTTFQITFTPSATGTRTCTVTLPNNDASRNPYNFNLMGMGAGGPIISGRVTEPNSGAGAVGVTLSLTGQDAVLSGADGYYSATVPFDWSGMITPSLSGLSFTPASRSLSGVQANTANQDFGVAVEVRITNLCANSSGNVVTMEWNAVSGVPYDIHAAQNDYPTAPARFGKRKANITANSVSQREQDTIDTATEDRVYYQVSVAGLPPSTNNMWAVVRREVSGSSYRLLAAPLVSDRNFGGSFGRQLAESLSGSNDGIGGSGDELYIMGDSGWESLYLDAEGNWRESNGQLSTRTLAAGEGFMLARQTPSETEIPFSGKVGNVGTNSLSIRTGWNIIAPSEGRDLDVAATLATADPVGGAYEEAADMVIFQDADGSWHRAIYITGWGAPYDGNWFDLGTFTILDEEFEPGEACYYYRQESGGATSVEF